MKLSTMHTDLREDFLPKRAARNRPADGTSSAELRRFSSFGGTAVGRAALVGNRATNILMEMLPESDAGVTGPQAA
jgi:hypothetical protein